MIIIIAIFIWLYAVTEKQYEHIFQAQVVLINQPKDYVVLKNYTKKIGVQIQGSGKLLLRALINAKIEINVDIAHQTKSPINVKLNLNNLKLPASTTNLTPIKFVDKDTLVFFIEPIHTKETLINHEIHIQIALGYTIVGGIKVQPQRVLLTGPQRLIEETNFIVTADLKFENVVSDVSGEIELINPYPLDLSMDIQSTKYFADVQLLEEKEFLDISIKVLNAPIGVQASVLPSTLSLKIKGGIEIIDSMNKNDILAYVDYGEYKITGEIFLLPYIELPADLTYFDISPDKFELKFD